MNKLIFGSIFLLLILVTQTSQSYSSLRSIFDREDYYNGAGADDSISSEEDTDKPKTWVLLVAGSNGWSNYRHQADICHAYQVIKNHGIPAENIITMMYDDIANNEENLFPGKIYNTPARKDVYKGVQIDYKGEDVNPKNFLAVLSGNKSAVEGGNGKVIQSTKTDKIFVFFSDHGAPGLIAFPDDVLTVKQLSQTLHSMHRNQKYSELTFYLEACESGSMFDGKILPADMKIYAVTAANGHESSWGCYCEEGDLPCLGDLFSVNWIVDSEKEDHNSETLKHQFDIVKQLTNKSHVCTFGDLQIMKEHVSEFQGQEKSNEPTGPSESPHDYTMWPSRDIPLLYLMSKRDNEQSQTVKRSLTHRIHVMQKKRRYLESQVVELVKKIVHDENNQKRVLSVYPTQLDKHLDCHHNVVNAFHRACFDFSKNPYAMKYVYVLANLCEMGIETERLVTSLMDHCSDKDEDILNIE